MLVILLYPLPAHGEHHRVLLSIYLIFVLISKSLFLRFQQQFKMSSLCFLGTFFGYLNSFSM